MALSCPVKDWWVFIAYNATMRVSWPRLLALSSFGFALTLVANTLDPAVYGHKVLQLAPENPNTLLGLSTFAAYLFGMVLGPIIGALSDKTQHRFGARLPYFLVGVPLVILALYLIASAPSVGVFLMAVFLLRGSDNLIISPWQALFPDQIPDEQRGFAAGIKSFLDILAVLVGRFASGEILSQAGELGDRAALLAVSVPVSVLLAALVFTFLAVRELPRRQSASASMQALESLKQIFTIDWRARPAFTWWFINRALFWAGFTILGTFLLFFVIDVLGMVEADAQRYLARLSLVLGGAILLMALPTGRLADRFGRVPLVVAGCAATALGSVLILFFRSPAAVTLAGVIIGVGAGTYISANFAHLTDLVPRDEAARYLGLANIASAGGGAAARLLGGVLIDPINRWTGSDSLGYLSLYALAALLFVLGALSALRLEARENQPG